MSRLLLKSSGGDAIGRFELGRLVTAGGGVREFACRAEAVGANA